MRTILHIVTRANDDLAKTVIDQQRAHGDTRVEVIALAENHDDYLPVLEKIFSADSVEVW